MLRYVYCYPRASILLKPVQVSDWSTCVWAELAWSSVLVLSSPIVAASLCYPIYPCRVGAADRSHGHTGEWFDLCFERSLWLISCSCCCPSTTLVVQGTLRLLG